MGRGGAQGEGRFLDLQAAVGITKHVGGFAATDELLALCHVERARDVLYVGCGVGVGPAYVARQFGCRVVGVDLSPAMVGWARLCIREQGVEDRVALCPGDALALPFATGSFDAVIAESVLVFVLDKAQAIAECARVARPGGCVGLNEAFWFEPPTPGMAAGVRSAIGPAVPTLVAWQALWEQSGLCERSVKIFRIDPAAEMQGRVRWIGRRRLLRAWGRALRLAATDAAMRRAMKAMFAVPADALGNLGYGLFTGRR